MRDYSSIELWYLWIYTHSTIWHWHNTLSMKLLRKQKLNCTISSAALYSHCRSGQFFFSFRVLFNEIRNVHLISLPFTRFQNREKKIRRQRVNTQCAIWLESETKETWTICWFHFDFRFWAAANRPPTISSYLEHTAPQSQSEHPKGTRCESWMRL